MGLRSLALAAGLGTAVWAAAAALGLAAMTAIHADLPYAESALIWSLPDPWSSPGRYLGLSAFTAEHLNSRQRAGEWGRIRFVGPSVPSRRPDVVSVNPIDDLTWGAAAYSVREQRCYLVVLVAQGAGVGAGRVLFGTLPAGVDCVGRAATPAAVTSGELPPER